MEKTVEAALITAGGGLVVVLVKWGLDRKKDRPSVPTNSTVSLEQNVTQTQSYLPNPTAAGPFVGKVATRPTMVDIANAIIAADPYDRTQIPKKYVGLEVSWPVVFSGLEQRSGKEGCATFDSPDADYRSVAVDINLDEYPKLKVLKWGHPAWIDGRIARADVPTIWLEDDAVITLE
jgi:hypothetical protein